MTHKHPKTGELMAAAAESDKENAKMFSKMNNFS